MSGLATSTFTQMTKFEKTPKEDKTDKLQKQVENLNLRMMKQPKLALKQIELVCCTWCKESRDQSHCRMDQEIMCHRFGRKGSWCF